MELSNLNIKNGLCISVGANIDSNFGHPIDSLIHCRPRLETTIKEWIIKFQLTESLPNSSNTFFYWSSLYETTPHGTSDPQPNFINTVLLVKSTIFPEPSHTTAKFLLDQFKNFEQSYGRERSVEKNLWLPRSLDLDILWWENLYTDTNLLTIPHPRFVNRNFVISPLAEILSRSQKIERINDKRWPL